MGKITQALVNIVSGTNNICCLCLNICDAKDLICNNDEATFLRNNNSENIAVWELILDVLGSNIEKYVNTLENICKQCAQSLFNSYTFKQSCYENASLLSNALDGLKTGIQNIAKPEEQQSLFVSLNLENFSSQFLYDSQHFSSPEIALTRYQELNTPKIKEELKLVENNKKNVYKDSEMLHDSSNQYIFRCNVCLNMYETMLKLRNHFTRVHIEKSQNMYKSPKIIRLKALAHKTGTLSNHQINRKVNIVCQDCGRTYKNKTTFKNHVELDVCKQERRHSPSQARYTCDYCNKKYTQKVSLRVHIQFEHGNYKAHNCKWCGKKFCSQSILKVHIVKHTRERNFACQICHRKFVTKESLLYHTRLHTGETPYKCTECSSSFVSASRRQHHVKRNHENAKPDLECDVCHGKFRSDYVLQKHKKTHEETLF